jgi:hypothetical protein
MTQAKFFLIDEDGNEEELEVTTINQAQELILRFMFPMQLYFDEVQKALVPPVFDGRIENGENLGQYGFSDVRKQDYVNARSIYIEMR